MVVVGEAATLTPTRTRPRTRTLCGDPCLDAVACEVRSSWMLRFGCRGCCALAVGDAALWKDAPPSFSSKTYLYELKHPGNQYVLSYTSRTNALSQVTPRQNIGTPFEMAVTTADRRPETTKYGPATCPTNHMTHDHSGTISTKSHGGHH